MVCHRQVFHLLVVGVVCLMAHTTANESEGKATSKNKAISDRRTASTGKIGSLSSMFRKLRRSVDGKHGDVEDEAEVDDFFSLPASESKRRWSLGGAGQTRVEGKRRYEDREFDKRKWNANSMAVWGKRSSGDAVQLEEEKRKWKANSMAVWGKRGQYDGNVRENQNEKRKWSPNSMAVWGK